MSAVVLHDFSGHPFQAELGRRLAADGLEVEHLSSEQYVSGKGHLVRRPDDAPSLSFSSLSVSLPFQKYSPLARVRWEIAYGRAWVRQLRERPPSAVIACNIPLFSLAIFCLYARRARLPWVLWHQDIHSFGLADEAERRLPAPLAWIARRLFVRLEAWITASASHVVAIGDAFLDVYRDWGLPCDDVDVIANWAPLDDIRPTPPTTRLSSSLFGDATGPRLLYAGTLGRKHNPLLLAEIVATLRARGVEATLTVVSEGEGADLLRETEPARRGHLRVMPFQAAEDLPEVLGAGHVLVALLEPHATLFSIPSKVLSYMAAGRPILGLMPADNPAAKDITSTGGLVADPSSAGAAQAADWVEALADDAERRHAIGAVARRTAERKFDAVRVTRQFEAILRKVCEGVTADARTRPTRFEVRVLDARRRRSPGRAARPLSQESATTAGRPAS